MNSVQNNPAVGTPIQYENQYGTFTFLDISDQLVTINEPVDMNKMDKMVPVTDSPEKQRQFWGKYFSDAALSLSPVSETKAQIDQESQAAIDGFFDGTVSEEELSDTFQDLFNRFATACGKAGYPIPLISKGTNQVMLDSFYSEFRRKILDTAVQRNNQEGQQYITGTLNAQRNWKYYNSDYYYQSDAALSAITDGVMKVAEDPAYSGFTVRDYKAEGRNLYYNFNTAVSNNISCDEQFILDPDMAPPKDFQWFYQSGGDSSKKVLEAYRLVTILPDGTEQVIYDHSPTSFDPTDFCTATTWASYRDDQGNQQTVSTDFFYNMSKDDLRNVADLLRFTGGSRDAEVNRFLQNLQVYSQGYFSRFPKGAG